MMRIAIMGCKGRCAHVWECIATIVSAKLKVTGKFTFPSLCVIRAICIDSVLHIYPYALDWDGYQNRCCLHFNWSRDGDEYV